MDSINSSLLDKFMQSIYLYSKKDVYLTYIPDSYPQNTNKLFNQTEYLAYHFSKSMNLPLVSIFSKLPFSKKHAGMSRINRLEGRNYFIMNSKELNIINSPNTHIVIVEDIITTGSTLINIEAVINSVEFAGSFSVFSLFRGRTKV